MPKGIAVRLAVIGLVLSVSTLSAQARTGPTRNELRLLRLGAVADSTEVVATLGRPDSVAYAGYPRTVGRRPSALHYRSVTVHLGPDGLKLGLTLRSPDVGTARGLRVGDTRARVTALYGQPNGQSADEWRYDIERDEYGPELIVTFQRGRVASIYVGYSS